MHHLLLSSSTTTTMPTATTTTTTATNQHQHHHNNHHHHSSSSSSSSLLLCKHSPSATLDLLILLLVLFSGSFLLTSYFSYIINSLSLLFSLHSFPPLTPLPTSSTLSPSYIFAFLVFFALSFILFQFLCCSSRSRRCDRPNCKGLKKAMEFDLQLQTEDCIKSGNSKEIDKLPWKGGSEGNPDYECLRAELRKMAPPYGRAVLLFRARCGCPVAKLEGWGPKRGRRHKKALANVAVNAGDHR